jgi:lipopolysaccharide biosynthesis glycosyltransferase
MNKIFIGYDSRESICYDVCKFSIYENTKKNVEIIPIKLDEIANIYKREKDPLAATEFSYSRFLVPFLCDYKGIALFCDCDFIFLEDIQGIFDLYDDKYSAMVCKHDYIPTNAVKMDGCIQSSYPKKNWSSLILWNCSHPKNKILTPELINNQTGKFLHRFEWLDEEDIGDIPITWNWLVGWYKEPIDGNPKGLHYTEGGPWFENYKNCEYSEIWLEYKKNKRK